MSKVGKTTHKYYKETAGLKVSGGQIVKAGTILTRESDKWKPGKNVKGQGTLYALHAGKIYFTKRRGTYRTNKAYTIINVEPVLKQSQKHS
ncbi:MAG: 50S ribosomal protein L27 [Candidatus Omnitrophota bacterium]